MCTSSLAPDASPLCAVGVDSTSHLSREASSRVTCTGAFASGVTLRTASYAMRGAASASSTYPIAAMHRHATANSTDAALLALSGARTLAGSESGFPSFSAMNAGGAPNS